MHNNISLDRPGRNFNTEKTSPQTYKKANLHQRTGHFDMPMGLEDINQFENRSEVRIKILVMKVETYFHSECRSLSQTSQWIYCFYTKLTVTIIY